MAGRCYIHSEYGAKLFEIRNDLYNSDKKEIYYDIKATSDSSRMLVGALMIGEKNDVKAFVFLNIMLEPIESTRITSYNVCYTKLLRKYKQFYNR